MTQTPMKDTREAIYAQAEAAIKTLRAALGETEAVKQLDTVVELKDHMLLEIQTQNQRAKAAEAEVLALKKELEALRAQPVSGLPDGLREAQKAFVLSALGAMDYRSKQAEVGTMSDVGRMYNVVALFDRWLTLGGLEFPRESKRLLGLILPRMKAHKVKAGNFWTLPARGGGSFDYKPNIFNDKEADLAWCIITILAYGCAQLKGDAEAQALKEKVVMYLDDNAQYWRDARKDAAQYLPNDGTYHAEMARGVAYALLGRLSPDDLKLQFPKLAIAQITAALETLGRFETPYGTGIIWPVMVPAFRKGAKPFAEGAEYGAMQSIYAVLAAAYMRILGKLGYTPFSDAKVMQQISTGVMYGAFHGMPATVMLPGKSFRAWIDNCIHPSNWFDRRDRKTMPKPVEVVSVGTGKRFYIGVNGEWNRYDTSLEHVENSIGGLLLQDAPEGLVADYLKNYAGAAGKPLVKFDATNGFASQVGLELRMLKEAN